MSVKWFAVFLCAAAAVVGCTSKEPPPPSKAPAAKPLLIGLIPEQNIFKQLERYGPLADYLSRKTGVTVQLKILPRYGNIISNFSSSSLDGAFFGSFTYALAHSRLGVEVVGRPLGRDNTSTYHGLIFVRRESGIRSVRDMKGKRFALVDKATTAGYLLPQEYFHRHGIPDCRKYLKECYFTGTHEDAIYDVLNGKADIGAAKNTIFNRLARIDPRIGEELVVLERSPDVPENGLALRKDIDPSLRRRIADALLAMDRDPDGSRVLQGFGASKFIVTTNEDYAPVFRYAKEIRLDLATYDYLNR